MKNQVHRTNANRVVSIGMSARTVISSALICLTLGWLFFKSGNTITKIAIVPFFICGLCVFLKRTLNLLLGIMSLKENESAPPTQQFKKRLMAVQTFLDQSYLFGFFLFWFGFLIIFDYFAIKDWANGGNQLFIFSLLFWAMGIFVGIKKFKR